MKRKKRVQVKGTGRYWGARWTCNQTSMDYESDEEPEDRGHESSSNITRKETPENFPVLTSPPPMRKPSKKRTRDTDKEEKTSHFNELMSVMKESASHLVRQQAKSANIQDRERESFFEWLHNFTSRMPRRNWRDFHQRTLALAMEFTPAESPQPNTPRPRILQGASTSHAQHPMDPLPRPTTGTTSNVDMLQSQQYGGPNTQQMVSNFLLYLYKKFLL